LLILSNFILLLVLISSYVGDIDFSIKPNCEYEIVDIHHHEISVQVELGFCIWFTTSKEPWNTPGAQQFKQFKKFNEYFCTTKELRKSKLNKLNKNVG